MEPESSEARELTLNDAALEKLKLEISVLKKELKTRSTWKDKLIQSLPVIAALLTVASFWFGIIKYNNEREREFKKPLWEKQLSFYLEATKATATLAWLIREKQGEPRQEWERARLRFFQLYYGELAVVEDSKVSQAMIQFRECLNDYEDGGCDQETLTDISLSLAGLCRDSVSESWKLPLGEAKRR